MEGTWGAVAIGGVEDTTLPPVGQSTWLPGVAGPAASNGSFAQWLGAPLQMAGTWADQLDAQTDLWTVSPGGDWGGWDKPIDIAVGAIYKENGESWAQAASGAYDSRWTTCLTKLNTYRQGKGATYIRFAHEFSLSYFPWSVSSSEAANFVTAFRRFSNLRKSIFPEGKMVWCPNDGADSSLDIRNCWPGIDHVDVYGVDSYNHWPAYNNASQIEARFNATQNGGAPQGIEKHRQQAAIWGVPLAICEWGSNANPSDGGAGMDAPNFYQYFFDWLTEHGGSGPGQVLYEVLFNVSGYSGQYTLYPSTTQPQSAAKYKQLWSTHPGAS